MRFIRYLVLVFLVFTTSELRSQMANLTIIVENINDTIGTIRIGIYNKSETFPHEEDTYTSAVLKAGKQVSYTFVDLPLDYYAVGVIYDLDNSGSLSKNKLGIPQERYGFSNNIFGPFGKPPKFNQASVKLERDLTIYIKLR